MRSLPVPKHQAEPGHIWLKHEWGPVHPTKACATSTVDVTASPLYEQHTRPRRQSSIDSALTQAVHHTSRLDRLNEASGSTNIGSICCRHSTCRRSAHAGPKSLMATPHLLRKLCTVSLTARLSDADQQPVHCMYRR